MGPGGLRTRKAPALAGMCPGRATSGGHPSPRSAPPSGFGDILSPGLVDGQDVAFAVPEPGRTFRSDPRDLVDRVERRVVVVLERDALGPQLGHHRLQSVDLEAGEG